MRALAPPNHDVILPRRMRTRHQPRTHSARQPLLCAGPHTEDAAPTSVTLRCRFFCSSPPPGTVRTRQTQAAQSCSPRLHPTSSMPASDCPREAVSRNTLRCGARRERAVRLASRTAVQFSAMPWACTSGSQSACCCKARETVPEGANLAAANEAT